jgi:carboxyl-terminal processing protease
MQKRIKAGLVSAVCLVCVLSLWGLYAALPAVALDRQAYKNLKLFNQVLDMVQKNYVEPVEQKTLVQGAINGMMKSLDPHSSFMTAEMYKELESRPEAFSAGSGLKSRF